MLFRKQKMIICVFVISRPGVRIRPQLQKLHTEEFPSGQRGQTVNLLAMPSVVRIHPPPPYLRNPNLIPIGDGFGFLVYIEDIEV